MRAPRAHWLTQGDEHTRRVHAIQTSPNAPQTCPLLRSRARRQCTAPGRPASPQRAPLCTAHATRVHVAPPPPAHMQESTHRSKGTCTTQSCGGGDTEAQSGLGNRRPLPPAGGNPRPASQKPPWPLPPRSEMICTLARADAGMRKHKRNPPPAPLPRHCPDAAPVLRLPRSSGVGRDPAWRMLGPHHERRPRKYEKQQMHRLRAHRHRSTHVGPCNERLMAC